MTQSREEVLNKAFELGRKYEKENGNCAQCTVAAIFGALGIDNEDVFRAATGLSDGIGLTGNGDCGALSAAAVAISYLYGRKKEDFANQRKMIKSCLMSKKLHDQFLAKYGTLRCTDLLTKRMGRSFNLWDPAEVALLEKMGMRNYTSEVVADVARMAVGIILDEREREAAQKKA
ncbi:MAG: C-GCAxxG-C-C family protein [Dehalococcoidales bacterium]|nr:C-GCAxxG-C-C family protein [Dehalococcoidales bacterium]